MRILLAVLLLTTLALTACGGEPEHPELKESRQIAEKWLKDFPDLNLHTGVYSNPLNRLEYDEHPALPDVIYESAAVREFRSQLPAERRTALEEQIYTFLWKELFRHVSIKITNVELSYGGGDGLVTATVAGDMTIDLEEHPPLRLDVSVPVMMLVSTFIDLVLNWAYDDDNIVVAINDQ